VVVSVPETAKGATLFTPSMKSYFFCAALSYTEQNRRLPNNEPQNIEVNRPPDADNRTDSYY
jgi:hypothetical protein